MNLRTFFQFLYNASYWILCAILFALILITPGDTVYQAYKNHQLYNVFVVCGCLFLTGLLACTIYFVRLYTNRQVLAGIPKTWIPVEKGDVNKKVRKMIVASLVRSAVIAWDARPRLESTPPVVVSEPEAIDATARPNTTSDKKKGSGMLHKKRRSETEKDDHVITIPPDPPAWGDISHKGWSSPASPDLPNLQYTTVILELPHLIEARAVSVAPPDYESMVNPPMPDLRAVDLLQRPAYMGLRDYIAHLLSIGVVTSAPTATEFLAHYEHARFSGEPLSEHEFRHLMKLFADLLRSIEELSPAILASLDIEFPESDIDDDNSSSSTPRTRSLASSHSVISRAASEDTVGTSQSRRVGTGDTTSTTRHYPEFSTAPATPRSKNRIASKSPSMNTFSQTREPYGGSGASTQSLGSSSQGSVIRLRGANEQGELPYTLMVSGAR